MYFSSLFFYTISKVSFKLNCCMKIVLSLIYWIDVRRWSLCIETVYCPICYCIRGFDIGKQFCPFLDMFLSCCPIFVFSALCCDMSSCLLHYVELEEKEIQKKERNFRKVCRSCLCIRTGRAGYMPFSFRGTICQCKKNISLYVDMWLIFPGYVTLWRVSVIITHLP